MNQLKAIVIIFLVQALVSCASQTRSDLARDLSNKSDRSTHTQQSVTKLEIKYRLGHEWYRIRFDQSPGQTKDQFQDNLTGFSYSGDELLKMGSISKQDFDLFFIKTQEFLSWKDRQPASLGCTQPFEVTYRNDGKKVFTHGCRNSKEPSLRLSKLIRDGEFLIYSQK